MPMVCACLMVACDIWIPAALVSCSNSSPVETELLSVEMCDGAYACLVKTDSNVLTTDVVSGLLRGTANRYREKTFIAVSMCV